MTESTIVDIKKIMDTLPEWEAEYTRMPEGSMRTIASPNYAQFHYDHEELGKHVGAWSETLPSMSYLNQVKAVVELNKILLPGTGRDLYCINYILAHINPGVYNIFIKALIGTVIAEDVSDHVITDCSGVHNEEGLYKITHRTNIKSFKYSPLTSIIIFIRMIKFYNKYSENSERVKIGTEAWKIKMFTDRFAEIEELKKCTDFCSLYIKPIFVIKDSNFYFHNTDIILNAKEFSWFNNPKEIFDISTALLAGWITHAGDFERINHVLSSIESRF